MPAVPGSQADIGHRKRQPRVWAALAAVALAVAAIVTVLGTRTGADHEGQQTIHLTRADQARLAAEFAETAGHPPDESERDMLVAAWVRDEVLYREAIRLGIGDAEYGRMGRVRAMDLRAAADLSGPVGDDLLEEWLAAHPDRFASDYSATFDQVTFRTRGRALVGKTLLGGGADWTRLGDREDLPSHLENSDRAAIGKAFGTQFADTLRQLAPSPDWQGPAESGSGWHLVRLASSKAGSPPPLAAIRPQLERDWRAATGQARADAAYAAARSRYRIVVDP